MEYALIGAAVIVVIWAIVIYNTLVSYKTQVINGFAQIDVQLKRRLDLIPNLVETAKKYMQHEQDTLLAVTQARSGMLSALQQVDAQPGHGDTLKALALSEQQLQGALSGFNLRMEAYPELKASANMQQLSEELVSTENRIAYARQGYSATCRHSRPRRRAVEADPDPAGTDHRYHWRPVGIIRTHPAGTDVATARIFGRCLGSAVHAQPQRTD